MAAAALVLGTGIAAYSSMKQGEVQEQAYEMEAQAKRAQAAQIDIAANYEVEQIKNRQERTQNAQMVAFGRSGVQATSGSPLQQMEDTAAQAMDQITATQNAARYRKGSLMTEASLSQYLGKEAKTASELNAFGSILGGVSSNPYMYDSGSSGGGGVSSPSGGGGGSMSGGWRGKSVGSGMNFGGF